VWTGVPVKEPTMASRLPGSSGDGWFDTTDWGLIEVAQGGDPVPARQALADLCSTYWYPLYAYIRRRGLPADRAQDLTQGFFASLLGHDFLKTVGPEKGKFRTFLLVACQNYLANQRNRDRAIKRGGGKPLLSIDLPDAEGRYAREPSHSLTAERLFERRWALTLLGCVLDRLGGEMNRSGKGPLFERLRPALLGDGAEAPYAEVAAELGFTTDAVKMAALRLRRRYRELVREEVARTVDGDGDGEFDDEIRDLFAALGP
jgi:DNA-directed RNA polymerase specialized sigma24 family protein